MAVYWRNSTAAVFPSWRLCSETSNFKVNDALREALPPEAAEGSCGQPGLYSITKVNAKYAQPHSIFSIARNFCHDSHAAISQASIRTGAGHSARHNTFNSQLIFFSPKPS